MTRLTALVPAEVCAAALGRAWPEDLDSQVRCIDEGTRALSLAWRCAPTADETCHADAATSGLVATPRALPVLGVTRGPLAASTAAVASGSTDDLGDLRDDGADAAAGKIRALSDCGVRRIVVVEDAIPLSVSHEDAVEAHRPLLNAAAHLRIGLVLVASNLDGVESLGYDCWASDRGCSPGLGYLPSQAFDSLAVLDRWLDQSRSVGDPGEVVTAPLASGVSPDLVRHAARSLTRVVARP